MSNFYDYAERCADAIWHLKRTCHQHRGWVAEWTTTGETLLVLRQSTAEPASTGPLEAIEKLRDGTVKERPVLAEPKGADLHVRMALSCLEELEPEAMRRKARMVRNFNEHLERESQLSAARVSLDRALAALNP